MVNDCHTGLCPKQMSPLLTSSPLPSLSFFLCGDHTQVWTSSVYLAATVTGFLLGSGAACSGFALYPIHSIPSSPLLIFLLCSSFELICQAKSYPDQASVCSREDDSTPPPPQFGIFCCAGNVDTGEIKGSSLLSSHPNTWTSPFLLVVSRPSCKLDISSLGGRGWKGDCWDRSSKPAWAIGQDGLSHFPP